MNFFKVDDACAQGLPYDIHSIMHFTSFACSVNGRATMTLHPHGYLLPMRTEQHMPTVYDYLHINLLYCHGKCTFLKKHKLKMKFKFQFLHLLAYIHACTYQCIHTCTLMCMYIHVHTHIHTYVYVLYIHTSIHTYMHAYTHAYIHTYV